LTAFREKIVPKLPATTSGIFLARIAVAACSLEDPYVTLELASDNITATGGTYTAKVEARDEDIIGLGNLPKIWVVVRHADFCHTFFSDIVLVRIFSSIDIVRVHVVHVTEYNLATDLVWKAGKDPGAGLGGVVRRSRLDPVDQRLELLQSVAELALRSRGQAGAVSDTHFRTICWGLVRARDVAVEGASGDDGGAGEIGMSI